MSQQQPQRSQQQEPIKYGDVFPVQGELSEKPVAPKDAAMMQTAETAMLGQTQQGGAASVMQSAAAKNQRTGFVAKGDGNEVAGEEGVTVTETDVPGRRILKEAVGGQVVSQYTQRAPLAPSTHHGCGEGTGGVEAGGHDSGITIGEALEATALTAGQKAVDRSDAAAIAAAEARATGRTNIVRGGVAAAAQSAATLNSRARGEDDKTKLGEVLKDASAKLPSDRAATVKDADGVAGAEMRNDQSLTTHPAGVAAAVAAAARRNQNKD